jgi:hypothetical protein
MADLGEIRQQAGQQEYSGRVVEVDLVPDDDECMAWMDWKIVSGTIMHGLNKLAAKKGKYDQEKFVKGYLDRSYKGMHGLTVRTMVQHKIPPLSEAQGETYARLAAKKSPEEWAAMTDDERDAAYDIEFTVDAKQAHWLADESVTFRDRVIELRSAENITDAEQSLRKKRSVNGSGTAKSEAARTTADGTL